MPEGQEPSNVEILRRAYAAFSEGRFELDHLDADVLTSTVSLVRRAVGKLKGIFHSKFGSKSFAALAKSPRLNAS
jgi:hypothetical protein